MLRRGSQVHFRAAKFHARQTWLAGVQRLAAQVNWYGERTEQRWADWRAWVGRASWIGAANRISAVAQRRLQPLHLEPSFGLARLATVTHSLLVTSSLLLCIGTPYSYDSNLIIAWITSRAISPTNWTSPDSCSRSLISTILRPPSPLHFGFLDRSAARATRPLSLPLSFSRENRSTSPVGVSPRRSASTL